MAKKRFVIDIDDELHRDVKMLAAEHQKTIREYLLRLIINHVNKKNHEKTKRD